MAAKTTTEIKEEVTIEEETVVTEVIEVIVVTVEIVATVEVQSLEKEVKENAKKKGVVTNFVGDDGSPMKPSAKGY